MNQRQQNVIEYLREENRVMREQLAGRRVRFTDDQRRRLAGRAKGLGRKVLMEIAPLVTPATLLSWHRKLIAQSMMAVRGGNRADPLPRRTSRPWWFAWQKRIRTGVT